MNLTECCRSGWLRPPLPPPTAATSLQDRPQSHPSTVCRPYPIETTLKILVRLGDPTVMDKIAGSSLLEQASEADAVDEEDVVGYSAGANPVQ